MKRLSNLKRTKQNLVACLPQAPANTSARANQSLQNYIPDLSLPWLFCALLGLTVLKLVCQSRIRLDKFTHLLKLGSSEISIFMKTTSHFYMSHPRGSESCRLATICFISGKQQRQCKYKVKKKKKRHKCTWNNGMKEKVLQQLPLPELLQLLITSMGSISGKQLLWLIFPVQACSLNIS